MKTLKLYFWPKLSKKVIKLGASVSGGACALRPFSLPMLTPWTCASQKPLDCHYTKSNDTPSLEIVPGQ